MSGAAISGVDIVCNVVPLVQVISQIREKKIDQKRFPNYSPANARTIMARPN